MSTKTNFLVLSFLCLSSVISLNAWGYSYTSYSLGGKDYINGEDGYQCIGHSIGQYYYMSDSNGNSSRSHMIGNRVYVD